MDAPISPQLTLPGMPAPSGPEPEDRSARGAEVKQHYVRWRSYRKAHEGNWFRNGAFLRGQQHVEYNDGLAKLVTPNTPSYRVILNLNRIRPKIRARLSKFFKSRPRPTVIPASSNYNDILNARASEALLKYHWDRLHLEEKYKDARLWASIGSKAYWWLSIDPSVSARLQVTDPTTGAKSEQTLPNAGDVQIEVGSPFEVLVADPAITRLGDQPAIQRIRMIDLEDAKSRYEEELVDFDPAMSGSKGEKLSNFSDRLATLRAEGAGGMGTIDRPKQVLQIEEFVAPCGKYPNGRYSVVIEDRCVKDVEELPYGMGDHKVNPYPVVEFTDSLTPGQFWGTTFTEQMIDLQRQYNYLFELLTENARACARPKVIVYKQHNLAEGAYTNAPGEVLELTYVPGLPPPQILQPQSIAGDVWNLIQHYDRMFDDLTQIYPASEGSVAKSTSGFQTNLLQEATDTVHAPDVREDELTLQEAAWKIRRLCKLAYDVPRLFNILGENSLPEVMEFSRAQIDEFAEVRIQAGSMLPDMKAAKAQTALELYKNGLFGNPQDSLVRRRVLGMLDMQGLDVVRENERADSDEAHVEQQKLIGGEPPTPPQFYMDHPTHLEVHQNFMKSPSYKEMSPAQRDMFLGHVIQHYDFLNPGLATALRQQYGQPMLPMAAPPPPPMPPGMPLGSSPSASPQAATASSQLPSALSALMPPTSGPASGQ